MGFDNLPSPVAFDFVAPRRWICHGCIVAAPAHQVSRSPRACLWVRRIRSRRAHAQPATPQLVEKPHCRSHHDPACSDSQVYPAPGRVTLHASQMFWNAPGCEYGGTTGAWIASGHMGTLGHSRTQLIRPWTDRPKHSRGHGGCCPGRGGRRNLVQTAERAQPLPAWRVVFDDRAVCAGHDRRRCSQRLQLQE